MCLCSQRDIKRFSSFSPLPLCLFFCISSPSLTPISPPHLTLSISARFADSAHFPACLQCNRYPLTTRILMQSILLPNISDLRISTGNYIFTPNLFCNSASGLQCLAEQHKQTQRLIALRLDYNKRERKKTLGLSALLVYIYITCNFLLMGVSNKAPLSQVQNNVFFSSAAVM